MGAITYLLQYDRSRRSEIGGPVSSVRNWKGARTCVLAIGLFVCVLPTAVAQQGIDRFGLLQLLPAPPEPGSKAQQTDIDSVVLTQRSASAERIVNAIADADENIWQVATPVLGPLFRPERLPKTSALFERATSELRPFVSAAKLQWRRPRPFVVDTRVACLTPQPTNFSYPSGAATLAYEVTTILSTMLPEQEADLMKRAAEYSENRIIVGVHYPSDVLAGHMAGISIAFALLRDAAFRESLGEASIELRNVLGLPDQAKRP